MSKSILLAVALAVLVTACGDGCKSNSGQVQEQKQDKDDACGHPMTNAQIIEETKTCYDAGLDAEPLHCGDDYQTVIVQCKPRTQGSAG